MYTLNTSADTRYFSRAVNLIGSVRANSLTAPSIRLWDLGLTRIQKFLLALAGVEVVQIPAFAPHWRDCYTWKVYVLRHAPDRIFLHLDAGNTVLCDLNAIFSSIDQEGTFFVDQGQTLGEICPPEYLQRFYPDGDPGSPVFAAGNIGFSRDNLSISRALEEAFDGALEGLTLGFSATEAFRDKTGLNVIRDCKLFRHDQSLLNLCFRRQLTNMEILPHGIFSAVANNTSVKILNQRKYSYQYFRQFIPGWRMLVVYVYCFAIDLVERTKRKLRIGT